MSHAVSALFFFFNDTATTEIYTLSLHDALPICRDRSADARACERARVSSTLTHDTAHSLRSAATGSAFIARQAGMRSEEHTSELQSRQYLVCRLLLEKKKTHR